MTSARMFPSSNLRSTSAPHARVRRFRLTALLVLLACASVSGSGCAARRAATTPAPEGSISSFAYNDRETLGEKLGRLDALMLTAGPDRLPMLRAEYRRLLAERTGEPALPLEEQAVAGPTGTRGRITPAPPAQSQPHLRGFRETEVGTGAPRAARSASSKRTPAAPRRPSPSAAPSTVSPTVRKPMATRPAAAINDRGLRQNQVGGVAAARSGNYAEAVERLGPVVASGKASIETRYQYARALERTGNVRAAAGEFLRVSKGSTPLAQKAYLDYCRTLAASGERTRARSLVVDFIRRNPDSTRVVEARRLLQTL